MRLQAFFLVACAGLGMARSCVQTSSSSLASETSTTTTDTSVTSTTTSDTSITSDTTSDTSVTSATSTPSAPTTTSATTSTESTTATPTTTLAPIPTTNRLFDGNFDFTAGPGPWQTAIAPASDTSADIMFVRDETSAESGTNYASIVGTQTGTSFQLCQPINLVSGYNYDFSAYIYYICTTPDLRYCTGSGYATLTFALGAVVDSPTTLAKTDGYALASTTLFYGGPSGNGILACATVTIVDPPPMPVGSMKFYLDTLSVNANLGSSNQ